MGLFALFSKRFVSENRFDLPAFVSPSVLFLFGVLLAISFLPNFYAFLILALLFVYWFQLCVSLTFDGFRHFSRYRLSHQHPILDKVISVSFIAFSLLFLAPVSLSLKAYSFYVSPDVKHEGKFYNAPYFLPFLQALLLIGIYLVWTLRFDESFLFSMLGAFGAVIGMAVGVFI